MEETLSFEFKGGEFPFFLSDSFGSVLIVGWSEFHRRGFILGATTMSHLVKGCEIKIVRAKCVDGDYFGYGVGVV